MSVYPALAIAGASDPADTQENTNPHGRRFDDFAARAPASEQLAMRAAPMLGFYLVLESIGAMAGGGTSDVAMSDTAFHEPSDCLRYVVT